MFLLLKVKVGGRHVVQSCTYCVKLTSRISYRRETALQGSLVLAKSGTWDRDTIFCGHYKSIFDHCDIIGLQSYRIRLKKNKK